MTDLDVSGAAGTAPPTEPPTLPQGTASGEGAATRAAPLTLDELRAIPEGDRTPAQRRRFKTLDKLDKARRRKEARDAKKGGAPAAAPAAQAAQADEDDEERDDAQRERETGGAWRLTLRIVGLLLYPFGYSLDALTDKECAEDVKLLAPLARRHRWLDLAIRYAALPYLLVERIAGKAKKRPEAKPKA